MRYCRLAGLLLATVLASQPAPLMAQPDPNRALIEAIALLQVELELLPLAGPHDRIDPEFDANRARLQFVDAAGAELLETVRQLGIEPTAPVARTLGRLPAPGRGERPPSRIEYEAAIADLQALRAARGRDVPVPNASVPPPTGDHITTPDVGMRAADPVPMPPIQGGGTPHELEAGEDLTEPVRVGLPPPPVVPNWLLPLGVAAVGGGLWIFASHKRRTRHDLLSFAMTDALTGAANRHRLDRDLQALSGLPAGDVSVLMIDVDHFKQVNDRYGHAVGDDVLRRLGKVLSARVRPGDVVYRYGGEEFCAMLPGASAAEARHVAERLRQAVATARMPGIGHVTVSVGVCTGRPPQVSAVLERADMALYQAKHDGRNRVTPWTAGATRRRRPTASAGPVTPMTASSGEAEPVALDRN